MVRQVFGVSSDERSPCTALHPESIEGSVERKGGIRGLCFSRGYPRSPFSRGQVSRGQVYNPQAPFIKGDFYIHYLLIRINKMKFPIPLK